MISSRSLHSLAQFLELQEVALVAVLLTKYGARASLTHGQVLTDILRILRNLSDPEVMNLLGEVVSTGGDLRNRVTPRYRFDQRMADLERCLLLDGYAIADDRLLQTDPSITDAAPVDDDLINELERAQPPRATAIIQKIKDSAEAFRKAPPDYNASLVNARVALETLAADVAGHVPCPPGVSPFDPTKWGDVLRYLRQAGEIGTEDERGLVGVFGFLSQGAHRPVGIPEEQMARLGRTLALNMSWFLLKNHLARTSI